MRATTDRADVDGKQRRAAIVSGLVLAAIAIGIYLVVIMKFFVR